jgi:hypothetical protein
LRKYTQEEVENFYLEKGYKVLSEYKNAHEPIDIIEIKTGYMFESTFAHFKRGEVREPFGYRNQKFQRYNIELYLQKNYPVVYFNTIISKGELPRETMDRPAVAFIGGAFDLGELCPEGLRHPGGRSPDFRNCISKNGCRSAADAFIHRPRRGKRRILDRAGRGWKKPVPSGGRGGAGGADPGCALFFGI